MHGVLIYFYLSTLIQVVGQDMKTIYIIHSDRNHNQLKVMTQRHIKKNKREKRKTKTIKRDDTSLEQVQAKIRREVKKVLKNYGIRDRGDKQANFHVLRESGMPAVLLEIMFIDTKKDADLLKNATFKQDMANGISKG